MENANVTTPARKKKKRSAAGRTIAFLLIFILLGAGVYLFTSGLKTDTSSVSVTRYRTSTVAEGEVNTTLSGSGTLTVMDSLTAEAPADCTVQRVYFAPGDAVPANATVMTLQSDAIESNLNSLYADLQTAQNRLAGTTRTRSNRNITAPRKGIVKDIKVNAGSPCEELSYLCVISTDGLMRVCIPRAASMNLYDTVTVKVGYSTVDGRIIRLTEDKAFVSVSDNGFSIGTAAAVASISGESYGNGTLECNDAVLVLQSFGQIEEVRVTENQPVNKGAVLFTLTADTPSDLYQTRLESVRDIEDEIASLKSSLQVKWATASMLATLSVKEGDTVASGTTLCYLTKADGYTLSLAIDESDIAAVKVGQSATVTLDALEGSYDGTVTNISYSGSGSYITSFTATVTTGIIENAYPGMSATANVITSSSGKTLVVPVSAVQYEGDTAYLLLANNASGQRNRPSGSGAPLSSDPSDGNSSERRSKSGNGNDSPVSSRVDSVAPNNSSEEKTGFIAEIEKIWNSVKRIFTGSADNNTASYVFNEADYERIYVTTGMSDGTYISVSGDGISEGTRIVFPVLETTSSYRASSSAATGNNGMNGWGGMGGMPNFNGMPGNFGGNNSNNRNSNRSSNRN